jgi:hypothetical protein
MTQITLAMSMNVQTMHGQLNEMHIMMETMSASMSTVAQEKFEAPPKDREEEEALPAEKSIVADEASRVSVERSPRKIFNDQFRKTTDGYCSVTLGVKNVEEFTYDWHAKNSGHVKGNIVTLTIGRWQSTVGHKQNTENRGVAKHMINLAEILGGESELILLKANKPDASRDAHYASWEMDMKATAKTLANMIAEFMTMKEGKVGHAKQLTVGTLGRRWKVLQYPDPTKEELEHLREETRYSKTNCSKASRATLRKSNFRYSLQYRRSYSHTIPV